MDNVKVEPGEPCACSGLEAESSHLKRKRTREDEGVCVSTSGSDGAGGVGCAAVGVGVAGAGVEDGEQQVKKQKDVEELVSNSDNNHQNNFTFSTGDSNNQADNSGDNHSCSDSSTITNISTINAIDDHNHGSINTSNTSSSTCVFNSVSSSNASNNHIANDSVKSGETIESIERLIKQYCKSDRGSEDELENQKFKEVPVFRPTWEEFHDFNKYLEIIESKCKIGLCKIIPPPEFKARADGYEKILETIKIKAPIRQHMIGKAGVFQVLPVIEKRSISVARFKELSEEVDKKRSRRELRAREEKDFESLERAYWSNLAVAAPLYGADSPGSLFDPSVQAWNLNHLHSILDVIRADMPGVNTTYLYFGQWKASFAWHVEDMNLHSINYLHFGYSKQWYCVPPRYADRFELVGQTYFPMSYRECSEFFRHKAFILSPAMLQRSNVPVFKCVQHAGEFMITFPRAYHCGFNYGFNCAESVNFATESWIKKGLIAKACRCRSHSVSINMVEFLRALHESRTKPNEAAAITGVQTDSNEEQQKTEISAIEQPKLEMFFTDASPLEPSKIAHSVARTAKPIDMTRASAAGLVVMATFVADVAPTPIPAVIRSVLVAATVAREDSNTVEGKNYHFGSIKTQGNPCEAAAESTPTTTTTITATASEAEQPDLELQDSALGLCFDG